jgi:hypothetical protein
MIASRGRVARSSARTITAAKPCDSSLGGHVGEGTLDAPRSSSSWPSAALHLKQSSPRVAGLVVVVDVERLPRRAPDTATPAPCPASRRSSLRRDDSA